MSGFHPFNGIVNNPKNVPTFTFESLVIGGVAIVLGAAINAIFNKIRGDRKPSKTLAMLQFLIATLVVAISYVYSPFEFSEHFQTSLPGMAFPALYYGVQSNLYTAWQ